MSLEHRRTAAGWHDGDWSMLYAYASDGTVYPGLANEIRECLDYVERSGPLVDFDPIHEHARLTDLLHQIEPDVAAVEARAIGRADGFSAWIEWQSEIPSGPTGDRVDLAHRVSRSFDKGDLGVLDNLVPGRSHTSDAARRVEIASGWLEPGVDDQAAHARWATARSQIWASYRSGFHDAVRDAAEGWSRAVLAGAPTPPPGLTERHLASARYLGAFEALSAAAGIPFSLTTAQMVALGSYEVEPPARHLEPILSRLLHDYAAVIGPNEVHTAVETAVSHAWSEGWDSLWHQAVRANAFRSMGDNATAQILDHRNNIHLEDLEEAAGPFYNESEPYIRPAPPAGSEISGRTSPQGWVVEHVGEWQGQPHEVVYDPRRFEVAVTMSRSAGLSAVAGWELQATDGQRGFLTKDRAVAARSALDRFAEQAVDIDASALPPGLEL